jgi:hypothetical protein
MKAHLGVDSRSKLIRAVVAAHANSADSTVLPDLLHGKETRVWVIRLSRPARGDPAARSKGPGLYQSPLAPCASWMRSNGRKSDQVQGAGQG